jgi:hypothetical protein
MAAPDFLSISPYAQTVGVGSNIAFIHSVANGVTSWSMTGTLPPGWTFDTGSGLHSGTCNVPGVYSRSVTATNYDGSDTLDVVTTIGSGQSTGAPPAVSAGPDKTFDTSAAVNISPINLGGVAVSWLWTGVPAGCEFNPQNGVLTGKIITPGTYNLTVTATNSYGTSTPDQLTLVVVQGYVPPVVVGTAIGVSVHDLYIELTTNVVSRTIFSAPSEAALFSHKYNDDKLINIIFTRDGIVVEPAITEIYFAMKSLDSDPAILTAGGTSHSSRWLKTGTGTATSFRFYLKLASTGLASAVSDEENDIETILHAKAEFSWLETNGYTPTVGPASLLGSSRTFRYDVVRDLNV